MTVEKYISGPFAAVPGDQELTQTGAISEKPLGGRDTGQMPTQTFSKVSGQAGPPAQTHRKPSVLPETQMGRRVSGQSETHSEELHPGQSPTSYPEGLASDTCPQGYLPELWGPGEPLEGKWVEEAGCSTSPRSPLTAATATVATTTQTCLLPSRVPGGQGQTFLLRGRACPSPLPLGVGKKEGKPSVWPRSR